MEVPLVATRWVENSDECLVYNDEVHVWGMDLKPTPEGFGHYFIGIGSDKGPQESM